jgi:hypothetical protein
MAIEFELKPEHKSRSDCQKKKGEKDKTATYGVGILLEKGIIGCTAVFDLLHSPRMNHLSSFECIGRYGNCSN